MTRWIAIFLVSAAALAQGLPEGRGKEPFTRVCTECHELDLATSQRLTQAAWQTIVNDMAAKGASGTHQDLEAIVAYLATVAPQPD